MLGLPYTHSGVLASALAMDKPMAKRVFASAGLRCPEGVETTLARLLAEPPLPPPFVVKPAAEGSSVGVVIVPDHDLRPLTDRNDVDPDCRLLVERYVAGRELTCAVLGDEPLAVTEIRPNDGFYDYRAKYTEGFASHLVPAPLSPDLYDEVMEAALRAHRVLGCRGVSRADFRLDPSQGDGGPLSAGGQHPARHDAAVAGARAGRLSRHRLSAIWSSAWWRGRDATREAPRPSRARPGAAGAGRRSGSGSCACGASAWSCWRCALVGSAPAAPSCARASAARWAARSAAQAWSPPRPRPASWSTRVYSEGRSLADERGARRDT